MTKLLLKNELNPQFLLRRSISGMPVNLESYLSPTCLEEAPFQLLLNVSETRRPKLEMSHLVSDASFPVSFLGPDYSFPLCRIFSQRTQR